MSGTKSSQRTGSSATPSKLKMVSLPALPWVASFPGPPSSVSSPRAALKPIVERAAEQHVVMPAAEQAVVAAGRADKGVVPVVSVHPDANQRGDALREGRTVEPVVPAAEAEVELDLVGRSGQAADDLPGPAARAEPGRGDLDGHRHGIGDPELSAGDVGPGELDVVGLLAADLVELETMHVVRRAGRQVPELCGRRR